MLQLTGRVTGNAKVHELEDGKKVVHFSVAHNYFYASKKGEKKKKQITNFYRCSYWLNAGVAPFLTRGTIVQVWGYAHPSAYNKGNDIVAQLNFHVDGLQFVGGGQQTEFTPVAKQEAVPAGQDDLPF